MHPNIPQTSPGGRGHPVADHTGQWGPGVNLAYMYKNVQNWDKNMHQT